MRSAESNDPPTSVVGRVAAVLGALEGADTPLGISELAARTGLAKGSVHRLVGQLVDERLLERTPDGRLVLGVRLFEIGSSVPLPRSLSQVARPLMVDLHQATERQVHLATLDGIDVAKEAIIQGRVTRGQEPVGNAYVRLLDRTGEFTAEVVASPTGDFRFFAAPGTWTLRALSAVGNGDVTISPEGPGIHEKDITVSK